MLFIVYAVILAKMYLSSKKANTHKTSKCKEPAIFNNINQS